MLMTAVVAAAVVASMLTLAVLIVLGSAWREPCDRADRERRDWRRT